MRFLTSAKEIVHETYNLDPSYGRATVELVHRHQTIFWNFSLALAVIILAYTGIRVLSKQWNSVNDGSFIVALVCLLMLDVTFIFAKPPHTTAQQINRYQFATGYVTEYKLTAKYDKPEFGYKIYKYTTNAQGLLTAQYTSTQLSSTKIVPTEKLVDWGGNK